MSSEERPVAMVVLVDEPGVPEWRVNSVRRVVTEVVRELSSAAAADLGLARMVGLWNGRHWNSLWVQMPHASRSTSGRRAMAWGWPAPSTVGTARQGGYRADGWRVPLLSVWMQTGPNLGRICDFCPCGPKRTKCVLPLELLVFSLGEHSNISQHFSLILQCF